MKSLRDEIRTDVRDKEDGFNFIASKARFLFFRCRALSTHKRQVFRLTFYIYISFDGRYTPTAYESKGYLFNVSFSYYNEYNYDRYDACNYEYDG